jgi:nucleoside diphosphate kinase
MKDIKQYITEFISTAPAVAAYLWMMHHNEEEDKRRKQHKEELPEEAKEIFVIIKPDSVSDKKEIIESIEGAGFKKLQEEKKKLQKDDVKKIFPKVGPLNMKTWDYLSSDDTVGLLFIETNIHKDLQKVIDREVFYLNDLYGIIDDEVKTAVFITKDEKEIKVCKNIYDIK